MTIMPREAPDRVRHVSRSTSLPTNSNGLVVSRSVVRKPPRRAQSGERLSDMRAMYRGGVAHSPGSLARRHNRQRIVARSVLEMSGGDLDIIASDAEDDATINSNLSSGSISLKSPGPSNGTILSLRHSPERSEGSSHSSRRRSSSHSRKNSIRQRKPQSTRTASRDRNEEDKDMDRSQSNRSERRSRTSGSSRNRSRSRKRNSRSGDRRDHDKGRSLSSSLHEKRNSRGHRSSTSSKSSSGQAPNTSGDPNRATVTEDEIMELLTLDYEMPLTAPSPTSKSQRPTRRSSSNRNPTGQRRISSSMHTESNGNRRSSRSPARRGSSARSLSSAGDSEKLNESFGSFGSPNSTGEPRGIDRGQSSEIPQSPRHRIAPRRTKSDDSPALDNFLKRNEPRERKSRTTSGSRSVASMPAKAQSRRQRHRGSGGRRNSDKTDDTDSTSKPSSLASLEPDSDQSGFMDRMSASGTVHYHEFDESATSIDDQSVDLDLATARTTFVQQNLNERLQIQLSKTDELLYSVFPKHVADSLRNGQKVEPENHDLVTIFFSDIVGFTDISSSLDPMKVSDMLDRLYHSFDALSDYHDVFKVETIGDAYMAVTNLAKKQPDHCKRISEFAIDSIRVANQTLIDEENPDLGFVNIRVGFHSGPVVSNVVGTRNPRYCLFGDTVNTANRMESNSEGNRIHCSEASARLLRQQCPKIRIFPRGAIEVKGKGEMKTYWVHTEGSISSNSHKKAAVRDGVKNVLKSLRGERVKKVAA